MAVRQLGIEAWLTALGVQEYVPLFVSFHNIEEVLHLSEGDIRGLGVRNGAHRARIVSSLVLLKEKLGRKQGGQTITPVASPNRSVGPSPPTFHHHPDYASLGQAPTPPSGSYTDYVPIQIAYQPMHPPLGYIQMMPTPADAPGDGQELYKYPWYYGNIPRQMADQLVVDDGDFLIRDSISQPGDYVLSCYWKGAPLHFVINRHVYKEADGTTKEMYQFEENKFTRVSELVQFYISNKKAISEMSGAVIINPVNRTVHPDQTAEQRSRPPSRAASFNISSPRDSPHQSPLASPCNTPTRSPSLTRRIILPQRRGSTPQPLRKLSVDNQLSHQRSRTQTNISQHKPPPSPIPRVGSAPSMAHLTNPKIEAQNINICEQHASPKLKRSSRTSTQSSTAPPPKPSRITTGMSITQRPVIPIRNVSLYDDDGKDYSDYDQVKAWPAALAREKQQQEEKNLMNQNTQNQQTKANSHPNVEKDDEDPDYDNNFANAAKMEEGEDVDYDIPKTKDRTYAAPVQKDRRSTSSNGKGDEVLGQSQSLKNNGHDDRDSGELAHEDAFATPGPPKVTLPDMNAPTQFVPLALDSSILPSENKPLEGSAMAIIKALLLGSPPQVLAEHLTYIDLEVMKVIGKNDLGVGVFSGLEAITLPQGSQLRQDIIERYTCLSYFVSLMILVCSKYQDRARMIHTMVLTANELRLNMGNLFAFSAIMNALKSVQVTRLKNTWVAVKHNYAGTAYLYEPKLMNVMKSLDEGSSSLPLQNVTVPHVIPLVQVLEREFSTDIEELASWEENRVDYGFDILLAHLDTARLITEQYGLYRVTAENVLRNFKPNPDLLELCRTEFHLRLMWGARGASVNRIDRNSKLEQLLTVLSQRAEPSQTSMDSESSV